MDKGFEPVPDPPWWQTSMRGDARATLSREAVVTAALEVVDDAGLAGLSMRRVAERLETGAATLYWHVKDKEQLIHLLLDRVMGEIELPDPDPSRWQDQIRDFARAGREMFRRHPGIALASLGRVPVGPNLVRIMEWFLAVLRGAGIPVRAAAWFPDLLALVGAAQAIEDQQASTGHDPGVAAMADYIAMLSPDEFPQLTSMGSAMATGGPEDRFDFALDVLLRGLAGYLED